jgi:HPr kinase/phosphorylase
MTSRSSTIIHGVFLNIFDTGVLITGRSGIGKSELALALVHRGHQFIADDAPEFSQDMNGNLIGKTPPELKHLLEIRGLGIVNLENLFGIVALMETQILSLIIELTDNTPMRLIGNPVFYTKPILNIPVSCITLPISNQRRGEILVETLVRHYKHLSGMPSYSLIERSSQRLEYSQHDG